MAAASGEVNAVLEIKLTNNIVMNVSFSKMVKSSGYKRYQRVKVHRWRGSREGGRGDEVIV